MDTCVCVTIGVGNIRGMYVILCMLKQIKHIEVYDCVVSMVLGLSIGIFLGVGIGDGTGWEEGIPVSLVPEEINVASMGDLNDVRSKVELDFVFNKI